MGTTERGPRRSVTCAAVSEAVLTLLKWCVLVLLYLFFFRVMQVTWASLRAPARRVATPTGPVPATTATAASRPTKVANDHAWALEVVEGDTINGAVVTRYATLVEQSLHLPPEVKASLATWLRASTRSP